MCLKARSCLLLDSANNDTCLFLILKNSAEGPSHFLYYLTDAGTYCKLMAHKYPTYSCTLRTTLLLIYPERNIDTLALSLEYTELQINTCSG